MFGLHGKNGVHTLPTALTLEGNVIAIFQTTVPPQSWPKKIALSKRNVSKSAQRSRVILYILYLSIYFGQSEFPYPIISGTITL